MNIKETIAEIVKNMDGVELRSYSGRGMYGKHCLGVVLDYEADDFYNYTPVTFFLTIIQEYLDYIEEPSDVFEFIEQLKEAKTDQIDRDTIVYLPNLETTKDEFNA